METPPLGGGVLVWSREPAGFLGRQTDRLHQLESRQTSFPESRGSSFQTALPTCVILGAVEAAAGRTDRPPPRPSVERGRLSGGGWRQAHRAGSVRVFPSRPSSLGPGKVASATLGLGASAAAVPRPFTGALWAQRRPRLGLGRGDLPPSSCPAALRDTRPAARPAPRFGVSSDGRMERGH